MVHPVGRRVAALLAIALACGCSCEDERAETPSPPTSTEHAPRSTTVDPTPASTAPALSEGERAARFREIARLVREGRRLEHADDHVAALARFDEALAIHAGSPRVMCEAGYVAHRGGSERAARTRIDAALAMFAARSDGEPSEARAMCLYNRGLVAEALGEDAASYYRDSLALRPNATVAGRLAALGARAPATTADPITEPTGAEGQGTLASVSIARLETVTLVRTHDGDALERAIARGMSGIDELEHTFAPARVDLLFEVSGAQHLVGFRVNDRAYPLEQESLVIGIETDEGYQLVAMESGAVDAQDFNGASGGFGIDSTQPVVPRWEGSFFHVPLHLSGNGTSYDIGESGDDEGDCYVTSSTEAAGDADVLCRFDGELRCLWIQRASRPTHEVIESTCPDEPAHVEHESASGAFEREITITTDERIRITQLTGEVEDFARGALGDHTFLELLALGDGGVVEPSELAPLATDASIAEVEADFAAGGDGWTDD